MSAWSGCARRQAAQKDCLRTRRCIRAHTSTGRRHRCPGRVAPRFLRGLVKASPGSRADSFLARKAAAPFPSKLLQAHSAGTYEMARQFTGTSVNEKKLLQKVLRIECRSKNRRL